MDEKQIASSLISKKPVPGKVITRQKDEELGTTTYTLNNGIKVTAKQTDFKSDEILMNAIKKGGANNYGVADKSNVKYTAQLTASMGFGAFTPSEIEKITAGKPVSARMNIGNISNGISGNSNIKDFETLLQLVYLRVTAPRRDEKLFKAFIGKQKTQLQFLTQNPQIAFFDTSITVLYKHHPLAPVPFPKAKDFDSIQLDRALEIYKNEFGSADGYHFFFVGNFDEASMLPLIETYLGSIPSENKNPDFKDNGVRPGTGTLAVKRGKEKQSFILASYNGEAPYSEDFKLRSEAVAEVLNIKVIEEMREKLGSIYSGGYYANVSKYPFPHYSVGMQLPCGPENVEKLIAAANLEIRTLKEKGPVWKDLTKTLFEITVPGVSKDDEEKELKQLVSSMQQFYAGMMSVTDDHLTFEIATAVDTEDAIFYIAVPNQHISLFEKHLLSIFPQARVHGQKNDYNVFNTKGVSAGSYATLRRPATLPLKIYEDFDYDPLNVLLSAFSKLQRHGEGAAIQIVFKPVGDTYTKRFKQALDKLRKGEKTSESLKVPETIGGEIVRGVKDVFFTASKSKEKKEQERMDGKTIDEVAVEQVTKKISSPIVATNIRLVASAPDNNRAEHILSELEAAFNQFEEAQGNKFVFRRSRGMNTRRLFHRFSFREFYKGARVLLNLKELTTAYHLPVTNVRSSRELKS